MEPSDPKLPLDVFCVYVDNLVTDIVVDNCITYKHIGRISRRKIVSPGTKLDDEGPPGSSVDVSLPVIAPSALKSIRKCYRAKPLYTSESTFDFCAAAGTISTHEKDDSLEDGNW